MTSFVSDFVHQFTESIEKTISNQNKQIGNYIYNQKLLKCKTRLKTVCCNTRDDNFDPFESLNMSVVYEIDDNNMVTRNGEDTVDNSRARLIDEVLTHVFHMEVLVEKTLNNGKLFEDEIVVFNFFSLTTVHLTKIGFFRSIKFRALHKAAAIPRQILLVFSRILR